MASACLKLMALAALLGGACGSAPGNKTGAAGSASLDAGSDSETTMPGGWRSCPFVEGRVDITAECSDLRVPAHWDQPDGPTLSIRAKRLRPQAEGGIQIWMLSGGPGTSATIEYPPVVKELLPYFPTAEFYMIDQRGTGYSNYLDCPEQEAATSAGGTELVAAEIPACAASLQQRYAVGLDAFGISEAARDLIAYMRATRDPAKRAFIWAQSGGTVLAQRSLLFADDFVDGVVLERAIAPDLSLKLQDAASDLALRGLLELCTRDGACRSRLPNATLVAQSLWAKLADGSCPAVERSVENLQRLLFRLLPYYPLDTAIPAFIAHLDRCSTEDAIILDRMIGGLENSQAAGRSFSQVLFQLVSASELWSTPLFPSLDSYLASLDALYQTSPLGAGSGGKLLAEKLEAWPKYLDPTAGQWPTSEVPILALHGKLDPLSPASSAAQLASHYAAAGQHYIEFPYAAHSVVGATITPDGTDCALGLVQQFFDDPRATLNTSCVAQTITPDFVGDSLAPILFGLRNYWTQQAPPDGGGSPPMRDGGVSSIPQDGGDASP